MSFPRLLLLVLFLYNTGSARAARALDRSSAPAPGELRIYEGGKKLALPPAANKADAQGLRLLAEGSYDEAVKAFDRSLRVARRNPRALANRGVALAQLGQVDRALKDFDAALALAPDLKGALKGPLIDARVRRGKARLAEGKVAPALDDFYAAIRLDRQDPRGYAAVAAAGRRTAQHDTCASYATRALDLGGDGADLRSDRAACLAALGRREEALKDLGRAIELDPQRAELYAERAAVELQAGRRAAARRDARRAREIDPALAQSLPAALR